MTSGALVQVGRPPATRGFDGAAVPKGRFDPEPPWTPEERRIHVQGRSEPHRLQADQVCTYVLNGFIYDCCSHAARVRVYGPLLAAPYFGTSSRYE